MVDGASGDESAYEDMKVSERTIKRLGEIITGDKALSPRRMSAVLGSPTHTRALRISMTVVLNSGG